MKGAQFENVLVVIGRGWNNYNFVDMLEWMGTEVPKGRQDAFIYFSNESLCRLKLVEF